MWITRGEVDNLSSRILNILAIWAKKWLIKRQNDEFFMRKKSPKWREEKLMKIFLCKKPMTKKVNYFSHDYSARNDAKIISLRRKAWMEWLGIFWALVEMLYENGGELSADDESLENLAYEWRCEVAKIKIVIFECWLFVVENWKFFSNSVNERLKKIDESRERKSEAGKKMNGKKMVKK